jgi:hypothetical protein
LDVDSPVFETQWMILIVVHIYKDLFREDRPSTWLREDFFLMWKILALKAPFSKVYVGVVVF